MPSNRHFLRQRQRRNGLLLGGVVLLLCCVASLSVGTQMLSPGLAWDAVFHLDPSQNDQLIMLHLRIPRTLLAILTGCALGVAGVIMQALTRNPLADPGILGVNSGAAAAIALCIAVLGIEDISVYMWFGLLGAALAGAAVYLLGGVRHGVNPVRLVLAGAALTFVLMAITQIITVNSTDEAFNQFRHWAAGSLQGRGYGILAPTALLIILGLGIAMTLGKSLDIAALGHDLSHALGAATGRIWILSSAAVIVLAGAATAAVGPISFIGLTAPHLARFVIGPDHRWLLPYAMLFSAILILAADILGRLIAPPGEVSVGIMIALIGGPFFVALVRRRKIAQL
ncbi:FecCD family ABC transporter permease [Kerstersia similis]|uniref:FecCD family ABC transporter permease n=1 Tax=Kerstersia similis TaxID=206505 RepID=UPI0039EE3D39